MSEVKEEFVKTRPRVVDIGFGLLPPIIFKEVQNYLSSYTGVEIADDEIGILSQVASELKKKDSNLNVRAIKGSFAYEEIINELRGEADEVWIRNFRGLGSEINGVEDLEKKLFGTAFEMLEPGGTLLLVNTYDKVDPNTEGKGVKRIVQELQDIGFKIEKLENEEQMKEENHPLVAEFRKRETHIPSKLLETTPHAIFAKKPN